MQKDLAVILARKLCEQGCPVEMTPDGCIIRDEYTHCGSTVREGCWIRWAKYIQEVTKEDSHE